MARILVIEDDPFFADILACMFELEGHKTTVAHNAGEGVRLGLARRPDVVVADWLLKSDLHGGEVCRRILGAWPAARAIIITGHQEWVALAGCYCEGVEAVIMKPFHKAEILGALRRALAPNPALAPPLPLVPLASSHDNTFDMVP
jgi:two-component system, OmpR family, response regulator